MNNQTPDPIDRTLSESLQSRWPARAFSERQGQTFLANIETQNRKYTMQTRISNTLRPIAFIGVLALLVFALSWIFGTMRPNPANETITLTNTPAPPPTEVSAPASSPAPSPTSLPPAAELPANGFTSFPNVTFDFANPLPEAPSQLMLYRQELGAPLSEDAVRQVASQMGVNGEVVNYMGEDGNPIYSVTEGDIQMLFFGFPDQFSYFISSSSLLGDPLPFDQRVTIAEEFLNAHGLLTSPYRVEQSTTDPYGLNFIQLLDNLPLVYGIGNDPSQFEWIKVSIDTDGQVHSLSHSPHNFQPVSSLPLLTAAQAWAQLGTSNAEFRARYAVLEAPMSWTRTGSAPTETLTGYLNNENGGTTFYADDGRALTLVDIPADMPLYAPLKIYGVVINNTLDWSEMSLLGGTFSSIVSCGGGGGGSSGYFENANFGGGSFSPIVLDPSAPQTPEYTSPLQPGDVIDGVQGSFSIVRHVDTETNTYSFWFAGDETNPEWSAYLVGDALAGTDAFQNLPLKIWGTVSHLDENGQPVIAVARYEEAYPGVQIQAWLGVQQILTLEGQEVVVLSTSDGSQYVLNNSIEGGPTASLLGIVGDTAVVEGFAIPDKSFGGYPVLSEIAMSSFANDFTDLSDYVIRSNQILIQEDTYVDPALNLTGHVTIENAELMYAAASLAQCTSEFANHPEAASDLYVQPIWRFTGHFDDGRSFEIQVQALPDEYLR